MPALRRLLFVVLVCLGTLQVPGHAAGRYMGVASCAGSTCHGRAEGNGAVVRQDEIASWQDPSSPTGAHSRALAVLSGARGRAIAGALGLGDPTAAPACLGCHATYVPNDDRGRRFLTNDGVGCESCHGPAENWLAVHYTRSATHASNVAAGLTPLERPQVRASVCLDCHWGSAKGNQFVTHSMMAAGHPRVSFELDLFSALQRHHDEDADYVRRKGRSDSVKMWAVGQAEAVRRQTDVFARPDYASRGLFPEFYFFDCHSCHRQITDGPKARRTFETNPGRPIRFGNPPFNDENMILLSAVARTFAPGEAAGLDQASRAFHTAFADGRTAVQKASVQMRDRAAALSNALAARSYSSDDAFQVIATVAGEATRTRFTDYAGSVQAVMAVDTLLNALVRDGRVTVGAAAGIRSSINRAYAAVEEPNGYRPAEFRSALAQATRAIEALR
ncbi:multiheme c-type cytochrome [Qipengyuania sp.]|uniref:multiheme c-type cytochrome n=1 Tax=Qipengyuania sp. TaxID=2004515 RepID=UPI0035C87E58